MTWYRKVIWTKRFIEAQGHQVKVNLIYRDNQSSMKLENNGKESSGKRTRHFNIKYFYITDLIKRKEIQIEYCPTDEMIADYMTKPVTGAKFTYLRDKIMNKISTSASRSVLENKCSNESKKSNKREMSRMNQKARDIEE